MAARAIVVLKMSRKVRSPTTSEARRSPKGGEGDWGQLVSLIVK